MTHDDSDPLREALQDALDALEPPEDPEKLDPDYPPDYSPEERVDHVLIFEYPRWRPLSWISAAANTEPESAQSVILDRLAEGKVEISDEGVRRNRYHIYFEEVEDLTEKARNQPRRLQ